MLCVRMRNAHGSPREIAHHASRNFFVFFLSVPFIQSKTMVITAENCFVAKKINIKSTESDWKLIKMKQIFALTLIFIEIFRQFMHEKINLLVYF
jgi:hypothetical protein